jgi:16S rRNA (uracil1498-N3)-methyltransferase
VSRHRFLVATPISQSVVFSKRQQHQITHVLRLRAGDRVRVFDGITPSDYLVELDKASGGQVVGTCLQRPEPRTVLIAYPALLPRDKFEPVLSKLTELGVAAIVPVLTVRSLVRELPDAARLERWRNIVCEATEQCGRGRVPELRPAASLEGALQLLTTEGTAVMAYESEREYTLRKALQGAGDTVSIFVGPEGGFTPDEAQLARKHGARLITLGPRILRSETASPVLAALVLYERGDLSSWETS